MSARDPRAGAPSEDQLLAMAYADGELDAEARERFEARLAAEPALAREVAELRELAVLARRIAPDEPADHEWRRLEAEWLHAGGEKAALGLILAGAVGLAALGIWAVLSSGLSLPIKVCAAALVLGLALLLALTVRARRRTLPLDPYVKVRR